MTQAADTTEAKTELSLVVVNAGTSDPSSSRMLADRVSRKTIELAKAEGFTVRLGVIELRALANEVSATIVSGITGSGLQKAIEQLANADGIIVSTPVYKAGMSGLFKSFLDILDNDLLIAKPVALLATAGTARHALVPDDQIRPIFAYLRSFVMPTSVFAAPDDWSQTSLGERVERVSGELVTMMALGVQQQIRERAWDKYQHNFDTKAKAPEDGINLDTDMMRLAAGGK